MNPKNETMQLEPSSPNQVAPILNASEYDYDEETRSLAQRMGMSVAEMFELFDELNNSDASITYDPHQDCPPEWPDFTGCEGGYEDEGAAESSYGVSHGCDYNTPLHMPPHNVITENR